LVRFGVGPIAAGTAAFVFGFISYIWMSPDTAPANAGFRADAFDVLATGTVNSQSFALASVDPGPRDTTSPVRLASLRAGDDSEIESGRSSFGGRFWFDQSEAAARPAQSSLASSSFGDRFVGEELDGIRPARSIVAAYPPRTAVPPVVAAVPMPRADARSRVAQAAPKPKAAAQAGFQLASAGDTPVRLAYAPTDSMSGSDVTGPPLKELAPKDSDPLADIDTSRTAIYDITARTVYLPSGKRLEAHSGLGSQMDDPRHISKRMTGPTPPNVYKLRMRESLFHGVQAIRLIPTDESKMFGRAGILAHTYMLGPNGQSNGCVSFSDYAAFLEAFKRGEIDRLVVVERLANTPSSKTASDWIANTLKDMFRRS
jgi:type VI secretion system (T6SS) effector TldE1-like protein